MSKTFITGSHAYGTPTPESDIDLAVLVEKADSDFLWQHTEGSPEMDCQYPSVRFGKLNLVVFVSAEKFEDWRRVTNELVARRPVPRDEAVAEFKKMLAKYE